MTTRFPIDVNSGILASLVAHYYTAIRGRDHFATMRIEQAMDELARRGQCSLVVFRLEQLSRRVSR